jgi:DNA-binding MarR family transcriptional regulator
VSCIALRKTSTDTLGTLRGVTAEDPERYEHVGFAQRLAYQRASANLAEAISKWDVTPIQFQTLLRLGQRGAMTQNELGRSIGMPPANIHRIIRALQAAELVNRGSAADDKRVTVIELTAHGRQTLDELLPAANTANALTLSALDADDQVTLLEKLTKLAGRTDSPDPN